MIKKEKTNDKKFLKLPEYPGGKKALQAFIAEHIQYPKDALESGIFGTVAVSYEVNDNGEVENVKVVKGLFPSCDDEAVRLVSMLKYSKVSNHGVRLKSNHKINIHFWKPKEEKRILQIGYQLTSSRKPAITSDKPVVSGGYNYIVTIDNKQKE